MPCDSAELRVHALDVGETPDLCWNHDASCDLVVVRRKRVLRCCPWSMQNSWDWEHRCGIWASMCKLSCARTGQLQRDWHHHKEPGRYNTCTAQLCGCDKQSHDGKAESRNKLDRHSQLTPERKLKFQHRRWELLALFGCHRSTGRAEVALENVWRCNGLMWHAAPTRLRTCGGIWNLLVTNLLRGRHRFMTS